MPNRDFRTDKFLRNSAPPSPRFTPVPRFIDLVPVRVDTLARWIVRYIEAVNKDPSSQLTTALGAATVLLRANIETGVMPEPTKEEKDLAIHMLNTASSRGYSKGETVAAFIGAADGIALSMVRER